MKSERLRRQKSLSMLPNLTSIIFPYVSGTRLQSTYIIYSHRQAQVGPKKFVTMVMMLIMTHSRFHKDQRLLQPSNLSTSATETLPLHLWACNPQQLPTGIHTPPQALRASEPSTLKIPSCSPSSTASGKPPSGPRSDVR